MEYPYTPPVFLQNQTVDEIHARMLKELPGNIDKSEMQIPWDFTRPAAIEKAEFVEFELNETIRTMFPQWASGEWLDQHAKMNGVRRRSANHATGFLTLAGNEETIIEEGLTIATGKNVPTSVVFKTTEKITLAKGSYQIIDTAGKEVLQLSLKKPENPGYLLTIRPKKDELEPKGELLLSDSENVLDSYSFAMSDEINWVEALLGAASESEYFSLEKIENGIDASNLQPYKTINGELVGCRVSIQAEEGGYSGNVPPNSITNIIDQIDGLNAVTNPEATSGGTPEEDDDTLRERIIESARHGVSFTGCAADYIRWAKEVSGVGNVVCVPLAEGPGTVRLYIMDANGGRANDETVEEVRNHILCPDDPIGRLAPIGAKVYVQAPDKISVRVSANVTLKVAESLETAQKRFEENLDKYWETAALEGLVKYVFVGALLARTEGVANYSGLKINEGTSDIPIASYEFPVTDAVALSEVPQNE